MSDLGALLNAMSESQRRTRAQYHLTLGQLIERLREMPAEGLVRFDDGTSALEVCSYRGFYEDLALEPIDQDVECSALLAVLTQALDKTFHGYKGGEFLMKADTPLWVADYGSTGAAIVAAKRRENVLILVTKNVD